MTIGLGWSFILERARSIRASKLKLINHDQIRLTLARTWSKSNLCAWVRKNWFLRPVSCKRTLRSLIKRPLINQFKIQNLNPKLQIPIISNFSNLTRPHESMTAESINLPIQLEPHATCLSPRLRYRSLSGLKSNDRLDRVDCWLASKY